MNRKLDTMKLMAKMSAKAVRDANTLRYLLQEADPSIENNNDVLVANLVDIRLSYIQHDLARSAGFEVVDESLSYPDDDESRDSSNSFQRRMAINFVP